PCAQVDQSFRFRRASQGFHSAASRPTPQVAAAERQRHAGHSDSSYAPSPGSCHLMGRPEKNESSDPRAGSAAEIAQRIGGDPSPSGASGPFPPAVIEDIQIKSELGRYRIRGFGSLRPRTWATLDDLTFIPGTLT